MKSHRNNRYNYYLLVIYLFSLTGCNFLEEKVYTEYDPNEFLKEQSGIDALLTGAYARSRIIGYASRNYTYLMNEFTTDIAFETGGGLERDAKPYIDFTWAVDNGFLSTFWDQMYQAVASANTVLTVADGLSGISEGQVNTIKGEARFIRAASYYFLYNIFGPTPLIDIPKEATPDEIEAIGKSTPRAAKEAFVKYLVDDLTFAAEHLPTDENPIGRASKGAALGVLTKLYLYEKDWDNVIASAQKIIDLNYYSLYADYTKLFAVEGEDNKEYIYRAPCIAQSGYQNNYMPHAFPPNYPIQSNWVNFGAQFRTYTAFYKTFEANDLRRKLIIAEYTNQAGEKVNLLEDESGNPLNNARSFKYWPDPNAVSENNGNDIVYVRYADILLSKAEALNEKNGPNTETISLINEVRSRAEASEIKLTDFSSKEELRDFILAERGREFYSEGLRREDLIRHGKFISGAVARGKDAKPHHVLFPIPQRQMEANANLVQNEGYASLN